MTETATVPREPTEAMLDAARDWSAKKYGQPIGNDAARGCWAAMLAATPKPVEPDHERFRKMTNGSD